MPAPIVNCTPAPPTLYRMLLALFVPSSTVPVMNGCTAIATPVPSTAATATNTCAPGVKPDSSTDVAPAATGEAPSVAAPPTRSAWMP